MGVVFGGGGYWVFDELTMLAHVHQATKWQPAKNNLGFGRRGNRPDGRHWFCHLAFCSGQASLIHYLINGYSNSGAVGKAAFALLDFWLNDNEASESDLWTLNHALGDITGELELDNLITLRNTYREVMKLSGLSVTELGNLATKNLTSFN